MTSRSLIDHINLSEATTTGIESTQVTSYNRRKSPTPHVAVISLMEPNFGRDMLQLFQLDNQYVNLNAGSFGALPCFVAHSCHELSAEIECNPDKFVRLQYNRRVDEARTRLAHYLSVPRGEIVLVPNVSTGIATIIHNLEWSEGDVLIMPNTTFSSIAANVNSLIGPRIEIMVLQFPTSHREILQNFRRTVRRIQQHKSPSSKTVALFDSIVSFPGVVMPWKEMVKICREEGVLSIVDAAHSIGQEKDINLGTVRPDFWVSNCSKWLYARRGSAVLHVPRRNQHLIKHSIPPGLNFPPAQDEECPDFAPLFYWNGSADLASFLSAPFALDFRASLGEEKIIDYCHNLAIVGGKLLAETLHTEVMDSPECSGELIANMVNVRLPLSGGIHPTGEIMGVFEAKLLNDHGVYAGHFYHNGRWWVRASAQIFNEVDDFRRLGNGLIVICEEISIRQDHVLAKM